MSRVASSISILVLDAGGTPRRLIGVEEAAGYYCKRQVAWDLGAHSFTLRGGISRASGLRSSLTLRSIVAVRSDSGRRAPPGAVPARRIALQRHARPGRLPARNGHRREAAGVQASSTNCLTSSPS